MAERDVLTILPRPQVSVFINDLGEVGISVTGVSEDNERVEMHDISFPIECAEEVGDALLKIAKGS